MAFNFHLVDSVLAEGSVSPVDEAVSLVGGDTNDLVEVGMVGSVRSGRVSQVGSQHANEFDELGPKSRRCLVGSFYAVVVNKQSKEFSIGEDGWLVRSCFCPLPSKVEFRGILQE